jgi:hypothetical protein
MLTIFSTGQPVPDLYDGQNATQVGGFVARPVAGGIFAPLALWSLSSNTTGSISSTSTKTNSNVAKAAGGETSAALRRHSFLFW